MKKYDFSLHFTLKGQNMHAINKKLDAWLESNKKILDLSEKAENEPETVLHHCFLSRERVLQKKFSLEVVDSLDELAGAQQVMWYDATEDLNMSRVLMLQNLKRLNGVALFVGAITDGVKEEYDLAMQEGIECILIP